MKTRFLLTAAAENRLTPGFSKTGSRFPVSPLEFAEDGKYTTFQIQVRGVIGNPTNWSLSARFVSQVANTYGVQYSNPEYVPFNEMQTKTFVREGVGWAKPALMPGAPGVPASAGEFGKIAEIGDTIAAPGYATVTRTVENFTPATRLDFSMVFEGATGGTAESPAGLIVLLNTYSWGS